MTNFGPRELWLQGPFASNEVLPVTNRHARRTVGSNFCRMSVSLNHTASRNWGQHRPGRPHWISGVGQEAALKRVRAQDFPSVAREEFGVFVVIGWSPVGECLDEAARVGGRV
jgi:hypothetical protein